MMDDKTIKAAIQFLIDGGEQEAADILRLCSLGNCEVVDYWMDGSEQLEGLSMVLQGPRMAYEILSRHDHPLRKEILFAFKAVLPGNTYIKNLRMHAVTLPEKVDLQINRAC